MVGKVGMPVGGLLLSLNLAIGASGAGSPLAPCRMSQFVLALGPGISEATGQHTLAVRLLNRSARSCVLDGYPGITLYDRAGPVPFSIKRGGDQMVTSRPPTRVVVRPDRTAFVLLNHYRCDLGSVREATTIRIGLTGATGAESASIEVTDRYMRLDYCGKGDPGSILAVSPFEPTLRAARRG